MPRLQVTNLPESIPTPVNCLAQIAAGNINYLRIGRKKKHQEQTC